MHYLVVYGSASLQSFMQDVNDRIAEGYTPLGSLVVNTWTY